MSFYFSSWSTEFWLCIFLAALAYYAYFKIVISQHWKRRNVPCLEPVFVLGNFWDNFIVETMFTKVSRIHQRWKKRKLVGAWSFSNPVLIVTDLELIKKILVADFHHFRNHGFPVDLDEEPLAGHLFNLEDAKWRNLRVKLTPTFTSGKIKMMFPAMAECGEELQDCLRKVAESKKEADVKDIFARFTTDVISSCAFGIQTNSLKNPDSEFRKYGRRLFEPNFLDIVKGIIFNFSPKLFKILRLPALPKDLSNFFLNVVRETINYRENNDVVRNDFMQLLIQLKNKGKLEDADDVVSTTLEEDEAAAEDMKFSFNDAAAQAFVFFFAGFETSSTALTFALYELALNEEIQDVLQKEIDEVLACQEGKMTYEGIRRMQYLDRVVQECLRKHPPVPALIRKCNRDYDVPELDVKIEENTQIFISVLGVHTDPENFPNPEKFDPDRFLPEEKGKREPFTALHFGEGPRMCIGKRFALLQVKVGLVSILSHYNVRVSQETPIPLKYSPRSFILSPEGGMFLRFECRA